MNIAARPSQHIDFELNGDYTGHYRFMRWVMVDGKTFARCLRLDVDNPFTYRTIPATELEGMPEFGFFQGAD